MLSVGTDGCSEEVVKKSSQFQIGFLSLALKKTGGWLKKYKAAPPKMTTSKNILITLIIYIINKGIVYFKIDAETKKAPSQ